MSTTEDKKLPSKEEVLKFYKEQIEVAKLRKDLAELVCATAEFDAKTAEAIAKKAHFSAPMPQQGPASMPEGVVEHTITQEDMDNNPELAEQGIKVGDVVGIAEKPLTEEATPEDDGKPVRQLKKD